MCEHKVVSNAPVSSAMLAFDWISEDYVNINDWREIHRKAILQTGGLHNSFAPMFRAWCRYATDHAVRYGSGIGEDYVLGKAWRDIGLALRRLLDGHIGALDSGTLDHIICNNLTVQGYGESLL